MVAAYQCGNFLEKNVWLHKKTDIFRRDLDIFSNTKKCRNKKMPKKCRTILNADFYTAQNILWA